MDGGDLGPVGSGRVPGNRWATSYAPRGLKSNRSVIPSSSGYEFEIVSDQVQVVIKAPQFRIDFKEGGLRYIYIHKRS